MAWAAQKKKEGWRKTPDGLLPMIEIKKAGYPHDEKLGYHAIPAEEYISDGLSGATAGEKYLGPSQQYLRWRKDYKKRISEIPDIANQMLKEKTAQPELGMDAEEERAKMSDGKSLNERYNVLDKNGEIDPKKIPF